MLIRLDQNCRENVLNVARQLEQREYIVSAEPNFIKTPLSYVSNPNDHYFQLPSTDVNYQWALRRIGLPQAWAFIGNTPTTAVSVGIIGWGIDENHPDINHPELAGRVSVGPYAFLPLRSAGTQQAGIIGASGNNGIGVAGISWDAQLVSLSFENSIAAINAGRDGLIPILTASFEWGYSNSEISAVQSYTGLFVNAAGNDGQKTNRFAGLQNVLVVGASDMIDNRSVWSPTRSSNFGSNSVHLFAPGGGLIGHTDGWGGVPRNIRTTDSNNSFAFYSGTSAATPHVAGVAALLLSVRPDATTQQIRQAIMDGVDFVPALDDLSIANGRLNAYGALMALLDMPTTVVRTSVPNLSFDGRSFTINSVRAISPNALPGTVVYIQVNRLNALNNTIVGTFSTTVTITDGVATFTPGAAVNVFNENERIEILVFRDGTQQELFNRQIVAPALF